MQLSSSISTRLQYQHKSLVEIIDGLSEEQVRRNVIPGKWSIFENIVHLQTYQYAFQERLKKIMEEEEPRFERYTAEADPLFLDNCHGSFRDVMQDFISLRKEMVNAILAIPEKELTRKGRHPAFGAMNVVQWLHFFLLHEAHHLYTIFKLAGEIRRAGFPAH